MEVLFYGHHEHHTLLRRFSLWGNLKNLVRRDVVTILMDEVARLHAVCSSMDSAQLEHVYSSIQWCWSPP
ncbi:hypothetical protein TNCV_2814721 [Trichonephila clavipes]|nr:hypothetical protein TNCV_2814721 [Trichonephila clavipes]